MEIKQDEQVISEFLQSAYTDERLTMLLAHAEDGKLAYISCCCFIGIPTADHALRGKVRTVDSVRSHVTPVRMTEAGLRADSAFCCLGNNDEERRAKLIPLIHAEITRRDDLKSESPQVSSEILIGPKFSMIA